MKKTFFILFCMFSTMFSGCSQNHFNVPPANFVDRVKVLGVVPIMLDADSDIKHPDKEQLLSLLSEKNRAFESQFVRKLKATGNFYAVALMGSDPDDLFKKMLFRREQRDDATIRYNKYFWKNDELKDYLLKNNLDAVMIIVISGLTQEAKIASSNFLNSLTSNYNFLTMSAQILDANGTVLWEYPNFRQHILSYYPMINLQYPDFSESDANKSTITNVKFKTIDGIRRTLEEKKTDLLFRATQEPQVYGKQFDEMISLLKNNSYKTSKGDVPVPAPGTNPIAAQTAQNSVPVTAQTAPVVAPAVTMPPSVKQQPEVPVVTRIPVLDKPAAQPAAPQTNPAIEVVPAAGSTL